MLEKHGVLREVADYFGCSVDTIMRRMKQYDIERRPLKRISIWFMYKLYTKLVSGLYTR